MFLKSINKQKISNKVSDKSTNRRQRGFTIVEVMIVLAIAALITSTVLIAVPALQRSARDGQRSQSINHIKGAISSWASTGSNIGKLPTSWGNIVGVKKDDLSYTKYQDSLFGTDNTSMSHADNKAYKTVLTTTAAVVKANSMFMFSTTAGTGGLAAAGIAELDEQELPNTDNIHIWSGFNCKEGASVGVNDGDYASADILAISKNVAVVYNTENGGPQCETLKF